MPRPMPDHGTRARYQRGCNCADCVAENTAYQRRYRERTTPRGVVHVTPGGYRYHQLTIDDA